MRALTAVVVLLDNSLNGALVRLVECLRGEAVAGRAKAAVVHGVLEGVVLPAEDVVAVLAVSGALRWPCQSGRGYRNNSTVIKAKKERKGRKSRV